MLESIKILQNKFSKDTGGSEKATRSKVRNSIDKACKDHLSVLNEEFVFEAKQANLNDVIAVIDESPLTDKYSIVQSEDSVSIFIATLKEVDIWKG